MTAPVLGLAPASFDALDGFPEPSEALRLVGHEDIAAAIASAHANGRLHHALILAGPKGIGKATLAFRVARHLLGGGDLFDLSRAPDTASSVFRQVAQHAHHSVLYIGRPQTDSGSFKTQVTVDEIRRIGAFLAKRSHDGSWRVVIVDGADEMNRNAANALLKNLEEPPANTLFLLVTHQLSRLLPTIRSRCQLHRLRALSDEQILEALDGLPVSMPADATDRAAWLAQARGSVRLAILLAEFGGNDISGAIAKSLEGREINLKTAHALAGSLSGRAMDIQFSLFCDFIRERFEQAAHDLAGQGRAAQSVAAADAYTAFERTLRETETYNLDRKQFIVAALGALKSASLVAPAAG